MAKAQKGDLIRIVNKDSNSEHYENGDIFEVTIATNNGDVYIDMGGENPLWIVDYEYEIHRKAGEEDAPKTISTTATVYSEGKPIMTAEPVASGYLQHFAPPTYDLSYDATDEQIRAAIGAEESDAVYHPNHYTQGRFETIEVIEEITAGYSDGFVSYNIGNVLKYIARAPYKHDTPVEDLRKAERYLRYAIERLTQ
ncbi:hypothetical protein 8F11_43 [uncultured Caudovirales phage]|uniref:SaV-like n=1 Tax=uncultured Caudovirales phage TaxID=2100421 RepID=A0A2H4J6Y8_9CAUD|nr:hypothetical protein 8F11_43 [uncultured Caudovirales phage]